MATGKMTKWVEGDICLVSWRGEDRPFRIVTIKNDGAYLHAVSKHENERITPRTIRHLDLLKPLAEPEKKMINLTLRIAILVILLAALVGIIVWVVFPDKMKDK